jgi:hypothetical protein
MANKKRKSALRMAGILGILLVFGTILGACGDGAGGPTDDGSEPLPSANGLNALSGKSCFVGYGQKIIFSTTGEGASNGTYTGQEVKREQDGEGDTEDVVDSNGRYTYSDEQTGAYSWNEAAKTVTLKVERRAWDQNGPLLDKAGYRQELQKTINEYTNENGQEALNQQLAAMGFSSVAEYLDYAVNQDFALKTYRYSFSADGKALFLQETLPQNKGANVLSGQTYNGLTRDSEQDKTVKDPGQVYAFTASTYTFTNTTATSENTTGSYAIDSVGRLGYKMVYLCPAIIDGKNQNEFYEIVKAWWPNGDSRYANNEDYWAAETNSRFELNSMPYNSANKTIGWEDN